MPSIFPSEASFATRTGAAWLMATTHSPRSWRAMSGARSMPADAARSSRVMSGVTVGAVDVPTSMRRAQWPFSLMKSARKACSAPFVSRVPRTAMVFI